MAFGTLSTLDDLQTVEDSVEAFGEQNLVDRVNQALRIHNAAMQEAVADFAIVTNQRQLGYGAAGEMEMQELDQFGSPDTQKITAAGNLGLPLRFYGIAVQWTRHFVLNASVAQLLAQFDAAATADVRNLTRQIRRALLWPTNTIGYIDKLQTPILTLDLRALLNGDGMTIPSGPNGETFDGATHTHYSAEAALTEAGLTAALDTVIEHGVQGGVTIYIARSDEAIIRAFTGFERYVDQRVNPGANDSYATGGLDVNNPNDRAIGVFEGAEVVVKPWVPAQYQIVFERGAGTDKPLAIRTRSGNLAGTGGFGTLYENDEFPLRARALGREFGVGVAQRHKAAVHFSGGGTYTAPILT